MLISASGENIEIPCIPFSNLGISSSHLGARIEAIFEGITGHIIYISTHFYTFSLFFKDAVLQIYC